MSIHGHCSAVLQGCSMDGAHVGINAGEDIASADIRYEGCWIGPPGQTWVPSSQQMFPSEGWAQLQQAVRGVKVQVSNPAASAGAALGRAPQAQQLISAYTSGRSTEYVGSGPVLRDLLSSLTPEQMGMMTPEMAMQTMQALALTAGQGAAGGQPGASTTSGSTKQTSGRASCAACGAQPDKLQQCARCKVVKYCGRDCQTRDWPNHKLMCRQLAARQT
uniref:MYND-type domain-containing protein n=1 Tax=Chlamydomonas leiostraca TaxID=1034604 RepID=A0A7S0R3V4_9CHLO